MAGFTKKSGVFFAYGVDGPEFFPAPYFTELLANVTNNVTGYDTASIAPIDRTYVLDAITAVVNVSNIAFQIAYVYPC